MNGLWEEAQRFRSAGLFPVPVRVIPKGDDGKEVRFPADWRTRTFDQPEDWAGFSGIGVDTERSGVVLIESDIRGDEKGIDNLKAAGISLPATPVCALSQSNGQHRWYRANPRYPVGNTVSKLANLIDTRGVGGFAIAPPTVVEGTDRGWRSVGQHRFGDLHVDEWPVLPDDLAQRIAVRAARKSVPKPGFVPGDVTDAQRAYATEVIDRKLQTLRDAPPGQRDSVMAKTIPRIIGLAITVGADLDEVSSRIIEAYPGDKPEHVEDWVRSAIGYCSPEDPTVWLPEDRVAQFWDSRPELKAIEQAAYARYGAPWAVLGHVLVNVLADVPTYVRLDTGVGELDSSIPNLYVATAAPSGYAKGLSGSVAKRMWPTSVPSFSPGSGQVIQDWFAPSGDGEIPHQSVIMTITELSALGKQSAAAGSVHVPTLCQAWSGEALNSTTKACRNIAEAGSYRIGLVGGIQPSNAKMFLGADSADTGLAQRMVWFDARRTLPAVLPTPPEPLKQPVMVEWPRVVSFPEQAHRDTDKWQRAESRDPLDTHNNYSRCKIAFALAVMGGRVHVDDEDWRLAGVVMDHSVLTRKWVQSEMSRLSHERRTNAKVAEMEATGSAQEGLVSKGVHRLVSFMEDNPGERKAFELRRSLRHGPQRDVFEEVLDTALGKGFLVKRTEDSGEWFALA